MPVTETTITEILSAYRFRIEARDFIDHQLIARKVRFPQAKTAPITEFHSITESTADGVITLNSNIPDDVKVGWLVDII